MAVSMPTDMTNTSMAGNPTEGGKMQNPTLVDAWQIFADYDHNANVISDRFKDLRRNILALGVLATTMAVVYELYFREWETPLIPGGLLGGWSPTPQSLAKVVVIMLPITVSMLLTWANKFERGMNWILLRGAAESIKREIFLFRAKSADYTDQKSAIKPREVQLAEKIKQINERLMKTEVNKDGLIIYRGTLPPTTGAVAEGDDAFSFMDPSDYLTYRLEDQIGYYKRKVEKLGRRSRGLNFQIILWGALGTLLAALNFEIWVAVTTAIVGAVTSFLEYNQYENTLTSFNQTGRDLESLRMWWRAVPAMEKEEHITYERLVENTENILNGEHASWIQNMQDALEELYKSDEEKIDEMDAIVEKFSNDPDGAYFYEQDGDTYSAEELDAMGFSLDQVNDSPASGGSNAYPDSASATATMEATSRSAGSMYSEEHDKDRTEAILEEFLPDLDDDGQPDPMDLNPEALSELFGDLDEDTDDDDLADLFGEK